MDYPPQSPVEVHGDDSAAIRMRVWSSGWSYYPRENGRTPTSARAEKEWEKEGHAQEHPRMRNRLIEAEFYS